MRCILERYSAFLLVCFAPRAVLSQASSYSPYRLLMND